MSTAAQNPDQHGIYTKNVIRHQSSISPLDRFLVFSQSDPQVVILSPASLDPIKRCQHRDRMLSDQSLQNDPKVRRIHGEVSWGRGKCAVGTVHSLSFILYKCIAVEKNHGRMTSSQSITPGVSKVSKPHSVDIVYSLLLDHSST